MMSYTRLLFCFIISTYAGVLRNTIHIDLTAGKEPYLHENHPFDGEYVWSEYLNTKLGCANILVEGWDQDLIRIDVDKKMGTDKWEVTARFLNTDYVESQLTHEDDVFDEDENDFITIEFDPASPGVAHLHLLNYHTGLTPRELEDTTQSTANSWMLFVMKFSFEVMHCNKITVHDDSNVIVRVNTPNQYALLENEAYLREMSPRYINLACGKNYYSPYQKYGFVSSSDPDGLLHQNILSEVERLLPLRSDYYVREFQEFKDRIEYEQNGDVWLATRAAVEEYTFVRDIERILHSLADKIESLPHKLELTFDSYAGVHPTPKTTSPAACGEDTIMRVASNCGEPVMDVVQRVASAA